jgi:predicted amidohydrolase
MIPSLPVPVVLEVGEDQGAGIVVAVQPWLVPADYASADALHDRLRASLDLAEARGWLGPHTVVVLPEHVGTWLVAVGAPERVLEADTTRRAMGRLVRRHLPAFLATRCPDVGDGATCAVFSMRAEAVAAAYGDAMARLAADAGVTLVAGSVLLPEPAVIDGRIVPTRGGALRNASFVFGPDGAIVAGPVVKAFPTADELPFTAPGDASALGAVDTGAGRLGVLVCADGWFPAAWDAVAAAGADLVVVPQYTSGDGVWDEPWRGYSGWPAPSDVDAADLEAITEGEAWLAYGPTARAAAHGLDVVTVPLRGDLWDLGDDGQARWTLGGVAGEGPRVDAPVVLGLWRTP